MLLPPGALGGADPTPDGADPTPDGPDPDTVSLHSSLPLAVDLDLVVVALTDVSWLGSPTGTGSGAATGRQVSTDLELPIRDGSGKVPIRKSALIEVGLPRVTPGAVTAELTWQSASLAPLFPVFSGVLRVAEDEITLDGWYAPPLGRLGLVIDAGLLQFVARRTAQAFLVRFARHLDGES